MAHEHNHEEGHHHGPIVLTNVNRAFIIGISLNFLFVVIEVIVGLYIHSLSLLSDAGHNLADVGALALSLLAYRLLKVKANDKYTYGYRKTSILVALFNAAVLLVSIGAIAYEAIHRFLNPEPLPGNTIAMVAAIGIVINALTAILFLKDKEKDINIKSAYLHLMSDALVSLGLVIAGIVIHYTNWYWLDPVFSIIIAIVILLGTWSLLRQSLRLSLDGVPPGIDMNKITGTVLAIKGVKGIHHIHIWAISTTQNALTAHIIVDEQTALAELQKIKEEVKHELLHVNIHHATIEVEAQKCGDENC